MEDGSCNTMEDDSESGPGSVVVGWSEEKSSPVAGAGRFEFVLMGADGGLDKAGISQIRAHTTRELHKMRRKTGQVVFHRKRNRPGNIFFGSHFDAFQTLPQLPVEAQKPGILDEIKHTLFHIFGQPEMNHTVWPQGTKDGTFFTGMLLMSSVHLDSINSGTPSPVTTTLKLEAMRLVREKIQVPTSDAIISCISAIACLATCALVRGPTEGADEYVMHRKAYAVLIKEAFLHSMFEKSRFCKDVLRVITVIAIARRCRMPVAGLAPLADSATALKEYEYVFEDMWQSRDGPDTRLYSPVYDGRTDAADDPFPYVQREHLRLLLQMMQSVVKLWLQQVESPLEQQLDESIVLDSLLDRILGMPSSKIPNLPCTDDHVYEACRLVSVLMIRSVERGLSLHAVVQGTSTGSAMLRDIKEALVHTELEGFWGNQFGLLYWVMLVYHCAAFGSVYHPFAHTLQVRLHFELTYSYVDWHAALKPMLALKDIIPP